MILLRLSMMDFRMNLGLMILK